MFPCIFAIFLTCVVFFHSSQHQTSSDGPVGIPPPPPPPPPAATNGGAPPPPPPPPPAMPGGVLQARRIPTEVRLGRFGEFLRTTRAFGELWGLWRFRIFFGEISRSFENFRGFLRTVEEIRVVSKGFEKCLEVSGISRRFEKARGVMRSFDHFCGTSRNQRLIRDKALIRS